MRNYTVQPLIFAVGLASVFMLSGCGGSGSGWESKNDNYDADDITRKVSGYVVDDIVVGAEVSIYALDASKPDLRGEKLASTITNDQGKFEDVVIPAYVFDKMPFIIESVGGRLASGGEPPLGTLRSFIAGEDVREDDIYTYLTPLSTLVVDYVVAKHQVDPESVASEFSASDQKVFINSSNELIERFGIGLISKDQDLFTSPVILDENLSVTGEANINQKKAAKAMVDLRAANASLLILLDRVKQQNAGISLDQAITAVAQDQVDGKPDRQFQGQLLSELSTIDQADYYSAITPDSATLLASTIPGANVTLSNILTVIEGVDEAAVNQLDLSEITSVSTIVPGESEVKLGCVDGQDINGNEFPCPNTAPVVNVGNPVRLTNTAATAITIDASQSSDADGDPLTFTFEEISGVSSNFTLTASGSVASFAATEIGDYQVKVTVNDTVISVDKIVNITVLPQKPNNVLPEIGAASFTESDNDPFIGTITMSVDSVTDSDATAATKFTTDWNCSFSRFSSLPGEEVTVVTTDTTGINGDSGLSVTVEKMPFEGSYNCTMLADDGYGVSEKLVSVKTRKSMPASLATFGIGVILLSLLSIYKRRK